MKISQSTVAMSSYNAFEQEDMLKEETSTKIYSSGSGAGTGQVRSDTGQNQIIDNSLGLTLDRVNLSTIAIEKNNSQYSHTFSSQSQVSGAGNETTVQFNQEEVVEKVVETVVKGQAAVRILKDGDSIAPGRSTASNISLAGSGSVESLLTIDRYSSHFEQEQMNFSTQGQVVTEDGRTIDFSLDLAMDRTTLTQTSEQTLIHTFQEQVSMIDPLMINLDGGVPELGDVRFEFDLDNDGSTEDISFAASGSGFLSFDKNNDGVINNGSELFGPGTGNGFEELAAYDLDNNGWIDENDEVFSQLSVWTRDESGNDVLVSLADAGLGAICLDNAVTGFDVTGSDNELQGRLARSGVFLFENGNVGMIQQIDLAARSVDTAGTVEPDEQTQLSRTAPQSQVIMGTKEKINRLAEKYQKLEKAFNPLKEMLEQIRETRKELRKLLDIKADQSYSPWFSRRVRF